MGISMSQLKLKDSFIVFSLRGILDEWKVKDVTQMNKHLKTNSTDPNAYEPWFAALWKNGDDLKLDAPLVVTLHFTDGWR
jgi:hypothetical protein